MTSYLRPATASPMGGVRSLQADTIGQLIDQEQASGASLLTLKNDVIRLALFRDEVKGPVSVWHVHPDSTTHRQDVER